MSAIQEQIHKIHRLMKAFSLKLTGNPDDANDLYQETALRIISHADRFEQGTNFKAWALVIMRNTFINNYRKRIRRERIQEQIFSGREETTENRGEYGVRYKELLKMVNSLSDEFKTPFWMAFQGYKYEEISEHLNIPLGTIKSRIFFARKKLMKMYETA